MFPMKGRMHLMFWNPVGGRNFQCKQLRVSSRQCISSDTYNLLIMTQFQQTCEGHSSSAHERNHYTIYFFSSKYMSNCNSYRIDLAWGRSAPLHTVLWIRIKTYIEWGPCAQEHCNWRCESISSEEKKGWRRCCNGRSSQRTLLKIGCNLTSS